MGDPTADVPAEDAPAELLFDTIEVRPKGRLRGHVFRMRLPSARMYIAQRRGTFDNAALLEEIVDAIVEHDLDRDPDLLLPVHLLEIGNAWLAAIRESVVPPASGESSGPP